MPTRCICATSGICIVGFCSLSPFLLWPIQNPTVMLRQTPSIMGRIRLLLVGINEVAEDCVAGCDRAGRVPKHHHESHVRSSKSRRHCSKGRSRVQMLRRTLPNWVIWHYPIWDDVHDRLKFYPRKGNFGRGDYPTPDLNPVAGEGVVRSHTCTGTGGGT